MGSTGNQEWGLGHGGDLWPRRNASVPPQELPFSWGTAFHRHTRGRLSWLVQRQDLPIPNVALIFLCHPPPHLARSSQLGPPMSRTSQSPWGPWGPTLDVALTSLLPGRTSLVLPVTAAHASRHRAGRHRLPLMWLVSRHPAILPPWTFGGQQDPYPDPLGQVLSPRVPVVSSSLSVCLRKRFLFWIVTSEGSPHGRLALLF